MSLYHIGIGLQLKATRACRYSLLFAVSRRRCAGRQCAVTFLFFIRNSALYDATSRNAIDGIVPIGTCSTDRRGVVVIQPVGTR